MTSINAPSPSAVETVSREPDKVTRSVLVIAPFGGSDREKERRAILDIMRIKYLIEKQVKVKKRRPSECLVQYTVDKHRNGAGPIAPGGISKIASNDVLVALMTEVNANVAFELAVRNMLRPEVILIVGKDPAAVPVYTQSLAKIDYYHSENELTNSIIQSIVKNGPPLDWDNMEAIPKELEDYLISHDHHMTKELEGALRLLEQAPPKPMFDDFVQDLDPGFVLGSWDTYVPYAVFRINWQRRASSQKYDDNDREGDPIVVSGNERLKEFINWTATLPPGALSLPEMIERVGAFMPDDIKEAFEKDQARLYNQVILRAGFGSAREPIVFTDSHPRLAGKRYLPTLVALRRVGNVAQAHSMYLVVAYVEHTSQNGK